MPTDMLLTRSNGNQATLTQPPTDGDLQKEVKNHAAEHDGLAVMALRLAESRGLEVFCDQLRNPCVRLPDDLNDPIWPLYHQRVKAWFADHLQAEAGVFVTDKDLLPVLRVLEGRAWKAPRRPPSADPTWQQIERDPVALALIAYANQYGEYEGLTRELFQRLHRPDIQARLQLAGLSHKFPINTQVLSRRINFKPLQHTLSVIGLDVSVEHKDDGSHCTLRMRRPAFVPEPDAIFVIPSASVSGGKERRPNKLGQPDGADATGTTGSVNEEKLAEILGEIKSIREGQP
jgi:hypothetical protein